MSDQGRLSFIQAQDGTLVIRLVGAWSLKAGIPSAADVQGQVALTGISRGVAFDARELTAWDSSVLTFLVEVSELCRQRGILMDREGLPVGVQKLLALAEAVPERKGARREATEASFLERIGTGTLGFAGSAKEMLAFLGDMTVTFLALFRLKAHYRGRLQGLGLRSTDRPFRLLEGSPVRQQFFRRRGCGHLGRGHGDRCHRDGLRYLCCCFLHPGDLNGWTNTCRQWRQVPHHRARPDHGLRQLRAHA